MSGRLTIADVIAFMEGLGTRREEIDGAELERLRRYIAADPGTTARRARFSLWKEGKQPRRRPSR